jgi:hypothetical protein
MAARENEKFPTEWALYDSDEQEGEQAGRRFRQQKRLGAQPAGQRRLIGNSTAQHSCAGIVGP